MDIKKLIAQALDEYGIQREFVPGLPEKLEGLFRQTNKQYTVDHLKHDVFQNFGGKGDNCPVCNQFVKQYFRALNGSLAFSLIKLYKITAQNPAQEFFHINDDLEIRYASSGISKLKYWGLVVEKKKDKTEEKKSRTSGMWKITDLGKQFVEGTVAVQKYAKVYNKKFMGFEGEPITIHQAINERFDYHKLMNTVFS